MNQPIMYTKELCYVIAQHDAKRHVIASGIPRDQAMHWAQALQSDENWINDHRRAIQNRAMQFMENLHRHFELETEEEQRDALNKFVDTWLAKIEVPHEWMRRRIDCRMPYRYTTFIVRAHD